MESRVEKAMRAAARFLQADQAADGSFACLSGTERARLNPENASVRTTTFAPSLILSALSRCRRPDTQTCRELLAAWLLRERSPQWSYNYWARGTPEHSSLPYPDDLDATFCALGALYEHDPSLIDGSALGHAVRLLLATETKPGGPYRTWLIDQAASKIWHDTDLAVNSNIAYFLKLVSEPLPTLNEFIEKAITAGELTSPYYPTIFPLAYYMARAYDGPQKDGLVKCLAQRARGNWWGNPLDTALAVTTLNRLGRTENLHTAIERLLETQLQDGSWAAFPFCLDPDSEGQRHYSGSAALTTAFIMEALHNTTHIERRLATRRRQQHPLQAQVIADVAAQLAHHPTDLRHANTETLKRIHASGEDNDIVLLPCLFNEGLRVPAGADLGDCLRHLGAANLYGWMAYTIYDDFLDGEGDPRRLSSANLALRYSLRHFRQALPAHAGFQALTAQTFDVIDAANAWEAAHCRCVVGGDGFIEIEQLPNFGNRRRLAERSLGHALGPLGVLAAHGIEPDSPTALAVRRAFLHYLIARQLNDDLHDWEQDIRAGIATYVVTTILHDLSVEPGKHNLETLITDMRQQFWHDTLVQICQTVLRHTANARRAAAASGVLAEQNILLRLLDNIDAIVAHTLAEQAKATEFLEAYRTPAAASRP